MTSQKWPALLGLLGGIIYLSFAVDTTFAFDKPIHTAIAVLLTSGIVLTASSTLAVRDGHQNSLKDHAQPSYSSGRHDFKSHPLDPFFDAIGLPYSLRATPVAFTILTTCLLIRAALFHGIWHNLECIAPTLEPLLPVIFVLIHIITASASTRQDLDDKRSDVRNESSRSRRSTPLLLITVSSITALVALRSFGPPSSTYICATSTPFIWMIPLIQHLAVLVDAIILYSISRIVEHNVGVQQIPQLTGSKIRTIGSSCMLAAINLVAFGVVYWYLTPDDRPWMIDLSSEYIWDIFTFSIAVAVCAACLVFSLYHVGSLMITSTIAFANILTTTTVSAWSTHRHYASTTYTSGFVAISCAIWTFAAYLQLDASITTTSQARPRTSFSRVSPLLYVLFAAFSVLHAYLWITHSASAPYHPIDVLMWEAENQHTLYLNQSKSSKTLQQAVDTYHERYGRYPPPNFDAWYKYATARNSVVIDDFDTINNDLLPFFALPPAEIRERTKALIVHPWNDCGAISIRDGKAFVGPHVVSTHLWMMEALEKMINNFAKFLPDMDLAFNLNDEPRVAVAYERIHFLQETALSHLDVPQSQAQFQPGRSEHWPRLPDTPTGNTVMTDIINTNVFRSHGAISCPQNSPARTQRHWNKKSTCIDCAAPHSLRGFMSNWTMAGDVCNQPDLEDLTGIYASPAAFKATNKLYPVFSQGKPDGFNDILYPSAWLYIDKAVYAPSNQHGDPPWAEKISDLFWRGSTTDGMSNGLGQWKALLRARFVHLINNIKNTSPPAHLHLPISPDSNKYAAKYVSSKDLVNMFDTDVQFTPDIVRCGGHDCARQRWEFAPNPNSSDFQAHWTHKYLLDFDGAGFSGRFIPFMQSRSLPFKSGVFREWWHNRVTPWLHFVPLDIRGHGLWGTLAFFAGVNGTIAGKTVELPARQQEAEKIALSGRAWAHQALRKEDMEIYMFRLLLEWARMTDDWRDEIGFSGSSGSL